jgi:hypothetical protein
MALLWAIAALVPAQWPVATTDAVLAPMGAPVESMRADLALRLAVDSGAILLVTYEEVTWPDACAGATGAGRVCAQALQAGFIARFEVGGRVYRYHGSGTTFTAVSFGGPLAVGQPVAGVAIEAIGVSSLHP